MPETAKTGAFNPEMVKLAREARSLNQLELAKRIGVQQPHLSRVESGFRVPTADFLERLAEALDFPEEFFLQEERLYGFGIGELFHRRKQDISVRVLDRIHAQINIRRIHVARLLDAVDVPDCNIPHVDEDDQSQPIEEVARTLRARWLVPRGPLVDLCAQIEDAGGIVIPFDFGTARIDAISQWIPRMPPLFFVNNASPKDRLRFSLAHELGHMVCHANLGAVPDQAIEREANDFASEFLMPARDIAFDFESVGRMTVESLAELKRKWKTSMAALLERAKKLGNVTEGQHRWLRIRLGELGYLKQEPRELEPRGEEPSVFKEMIALHVGELGYTAEELATLLREKPDAIRELYLPRPRLRPL